MFGRHTHSNNVVNNVPVLSWVSSRYQYLQTGLYVLLYCANVRYIAAEAALLVFSLSCWKFETGLNMGKPLRTI